MAPPSRHGSPRRGSSYSPKKRKRSGNGSATKPTSPSKRSATVSPRTRTITPSSKASAEKALKVAAAVQVNIQFGVVEKYKPGIKILLPESIYGSAKDVSTNFHWYFCHILFHVFTHNPLSHLLHLGTRESTGLSFWIRVDESFKRSCDYKIYQSDLQTRIL